MNFAKPTNIIIVVKFVHIGGHVLQISKPTHNQEVL